MTNRILVSSLCFLAALGAIAAMLPQTAQAAPPSGDSGSPTAVEALRAKLVGAWAFERVFKDGRPSTERGDKPAGLMIFLPNGVMAVQVVNSAELRPDRADTEAQKAQALDSYTAFYGRYQLHPDLGAVVLIFDQSADPNLKGLVGDRRYSFDGDLLTMRFYTWPGAPETTNVYRRIP